MGRLISALILVILSFSAPCFAADSAKAYVPGDGLRLTYDGFYGSDGTRIVETYVVSKQSSTRASWRLADAARVDGQFFKPRGQGNWIPVDTKPEPMLNRYSDVPAGIAVETTFRYRTAEGGYGPRVQRMRLLLANPTSDVEGWTDELGRKMKVLRTGVSITGPAGKFDDCVVVEHDMRVAGIRTSRNTYCPGVGLVVSAHTSSSNRVDSEKEFTDIELTKLERIPSADAAQIIAEQLKLMEER
jgi:hypothetical protein